MFVYIKIIIKDIYKSYFQLYQVIYEKKSVSDHHQFYHIISNYQIIHL